MASTMAATCSPFYNQGAKGERSLEIKRLASNTRLGEPSELCVRPREGLVR